MGLTVAVTGPTGEVGRPFMRALERSRDVERIVGMARRPFDPAAHGWRKTEYRSGDVLDRSAVAALVEGVDVVVHLAFSGIDTADARDVNREGSRNVFAATAAAGAQRLVHASSVTAYDVHDDSSDMLTEDMPATEAEAHPSSGQKAEVERLLARELEGSAVAAYVFRPCIVGGPEAPLLIDQIPLVRWDAVMPRAVRALFDQASVEKPVLPDPGIAFQLVHHDDVALALRSGVLGRGEPGVFNLAGPGEVTIADLARELGYYSLPVSELAGDDAAEIVGRLPFSAAEATWITAFRRPVLMDSAKARRTLRWRPRHDALQTLGSMIAGALADAKPA